LHFPFSKNQTVLNVSLLSKSAEEYSIHSRRLGWNGSRSLRKPFFVETDVKPLKKAKAEVGIDVGIKRASVGRIAAVGKRMGLSGLRRPSRPRHQRCDQYQESRPIPAEMAKNYRVGRPESHAYEK
jgi:hypothetical protein